ncbi:hypothetical protein [Stygiolobus caldivivus]|uniref:Uncharacterized protein n=1 Tax=Stygiolobus caldivivus TaxID=2824673 RepID=A0A8D5ZIB4_9CREN|nr:hypothetical protein [Stygiolobus caldivivus]BCU69451.1 hypothetical protein KN1_07480 [Stygiolobus caldivivus]
MRKLISLLVLFIVFSSTLGSASNSTPPYQVKFRIYGPVVVTLIYDNTTTLINTNTSMPLYGKITIDAQATSLGYSIFINGEKTSNLTLNVYSPMTVNVTAVPTFVNLKINIIGRGSVNLQLSNGTSITISRNTTIRVQNFSFIYVSAPFNQNIIFNNNIQSNFYVILVNQSTSLNVTFTDLSKSNKSDSPTFNFVGIALGLIAISIYLFTRKKSTP